MFPLNNSFREFVKPVPVCTGAVNLAEALTALNVGSADASECHEYLVLVNDAHHPIGLVCLKSLIPHLTAVKPKKSSHAKGASPLLSGLQPSVIEPLLAVTDNVSLSDFFARLKSQPRTQAVLTDSRGAFIGLLERSCLLEFLLTHLPEPRPRTFTNSASKNRRLEVCQAATYLPQLMPSGDTPLNALLALVERLPLPLMLQTSDGQVLAQNTVWRSQVGTLLDADWTQQSISTNPSDLNSNSATHIRTSLLKNGQEQVLQLMRLPIEPLAAPPTVGFTSVLPRFREAWQTYAGISPLLHALESRSLAPAEVVHQTAATCEGDRALPTHSQTLWLVLAQDITEQQRLARELTAKNADLIQLKRLKDEFLACISHELRTPLTAVLGLSSLLKDQTLGELNQRQVHYAQLIYQSGRHLMTVVNDILDLTRMETGQLELTLEPVPIAAVCHQAFEQAKQLRLLESKQASADSNVVPPFTLDIESDLEYLIADELRLRQMLVYLLSNAIKFTNTDQAIGLKVSRWGGWIAFTIWDTGMGIPADKQHLIFQKFQQLENPLTRQFEGTGLGLVLTQRLARLHGGDVTFISKEGQGSQFTILLPPSPPRSTSSAPEDDENNSLETSDLREYVSLRSLGVQPEQSTGRTAERTPAATRDRLVLIVEAVLQSIDDLTEQLTGLGYRVAIARSGTEALEKARRLQPCILFLNPVLPLLSGWDVLTLLQSSPETRQIPVVVTATTVDEERAKASHAIHILSLPVQAKALRHCLKQFITEAPEPDRHLGASSLTVLRLGPERQTTRQEGGSIVDLNPLLHSCQYRVLESDDLEQAELLARVWKPNVVLLDSTLSDPTSYFQRFSQHTFLASLPLITLDPETTQAANQVSGLLVFPCLATPAAQDASESAKPSALLQVIQIAAGYACRPTILALDMATLPVSNDASVSETALEKTLGSFPKETEWLQALTHYLQTAGLRAVVGRDWQEVFQQIESQSVDLLLICWTETSSPTIAESMLSELQQLKQKLPILVLDHRRNLETLNEMDFPALHQIATQILPPSLPMADLLNHIHLAMQGTEAS
ncbi:hybrid sensor histidine kinase/response regulator [Leptolyngbya sp. FACHB-36]|uniref:ATP-binding response regulator n=1 Tax=Leptolyngbya sp. FACHB-36 TaxID=2692808 RepID=UPI00167FFC54|nr:hybrid sensor histidine kinase/response regulator [Leptolyngbya sp. FACHB-36]MBD2020463.1 hybrid sensor histidine kinase/response regulator [Leptolyngbya sp. FACHB-36]